MARITRRFLARCAVTATALPGVVVAKAAMSVVTQGRNGFSSTSVKDKP